jgi:hypothetical protein
MLEEMVNRVRLRVEERLDQALTLARWKLRPHPRTPPFDGQPRFALLTVNRATTRYLKLMLLTLAEQREVPRHLRRIVVCDNDSQDGGAEFLRRLAAQVDRLVLVENRRGLSHAHGMRRALAALAETEAALPPRARSNIWIFCDTDVIFRNPDTLAELGQRMVGSGAAFAGELRPAGLLYPYAEAQASFVAVRADWYTHPGAVPWVNHGAPAYWLQRSIQRLGGAALDFPSNYGGYILHRGRAAVASSRIYTPLSSYASAVYVHPHFMGVPEGARIWSDVETRHAPMLAAEREPELIRHLGRAFNVSTPPVPPPPQGASAD